MYMYESVGNVEEMILEKGFSNNTLCMTFSDPISVRTLTQHMCAKLVRLHAPRSRNAQRVFGRTQADHAAAEEGHLRLTQQSAI